MYKYKNPIDNGFKKVKLTKKKHNELFPNRKIIWCDKYDYWISEDTFITERTVNIFGLIVATITLPFTCLFELKNTKENIKVYLNFFNQKEKGKHYSEYYYKKNEVFNKILTHIERGK